MKVWGVRRRNTKRPFYDVRWIAAGNVFSERFRTKGLADHYRSKLLPPRPGMTKSSTVPGLPDSVIEKVPSTTWYAFALKWPHAAPNTRDGINEALTAVTLVLLRDRLKSPTRTIHRF